MKFHFQKLYHKRLEWKPHTGKEIGGSCWPHPHRACTYKTVCNTLSSLPKL